MTERASGAPAYHNRGPVPGRMVGYLDIGVEVVGMRVKGPVCLAVMVVFDQTDPERQIAARQCT